jgi:cytochrome oxidase assembly protein ShyY1
MDRIGLDAKTGTSEAPIVAQTSEQPDEQFPISPNASGLGEFKVGPATHAGYALTWFGLSGAGMVMTRKLLTRGR